MGGGLPQQPRSQAPPSEALECPPEPSPSPILSGLGLGAAIPGCLRELPQEPCGLHPGLDTRL